MYRRLSSLRNIPGKKRAADWTVCGTTCGSTDLQSSCRSLDSLRYNLRVNGSSIELPQTGQSAVQLAGQRIFNRATADWTVCGTTCGSTDLQSSCRRLDSLRYIKLSH